MSNAAPRYRVASVLLFLVAAFSLWTATGGQCLAAARENEITIISAIWGVDTRTVDVTTRMAELVHPNSGNLTVGSTSLEIEDPAPGAVKELVFTYKYHDGTYSLTLKTGDHFYYATLVTHAQKLDKAAADPTPPAAVATPAARPASGPQILTQEQMAGIVLIEGDKGVATGFIARVHDTLCVVTNLHVLVHNQKITVKNLAGKVVAVQGIIGAVGADIALLRIVNPANAPPALVIEDDMLQSAKIGDKVVVVGNQLGGGVATQLSGAIMGIGPARIEVDAAFQPGNSGSPIFAVASNQVIGVATFTQTMTLSIDGNPVNATGSTEPGIKRETRWFGYRLDSVSKWETIDPAKWRDEAKRVNDFQDASLALYAMYRGDLAEAAKDPRLSTMIERFKSQLSPSELRALPTNPTPSPKSTEQVRELLRLARAYAQDGVQDFTDANYYDYFRTNPYLATSVTLQARLREQLAQAFEDQDSDLLTYRRRMRL